MALRILTICRIAQNICGEREMAQDLLNSRKNQMREAIMPFEQKLSSWQKKLMFICGYNIKLWFGYDAGL
jgi:hypothetical protein